MGGRRHIQIHRMSTLCVCADRLATGMIHYALLACALVFINVAAMLGVRPNLPSADADFGTAAIIGVLIVLVLAMWAMLRESRRDDAAHMIKALYDHFGLGGSRTKSREGDGGSLEGGDGRGVQNDGHSGMGGAPPVRRTPYSERMSVLIPALAVMLAATAILFIYAYDGAPAGANPWTDAMEAYPDGDMRCHAVVVDSILHLTEVLYDSPYAIDTATGRPSMEMAQQMATDMVIGGGDSRAVPVECGAGE